MLSYSWTYLILLTTPLTILRVSNNLQLFLQFTTANHADHFFLMVGVMTTGTALNENAINNLAKDVFWSTSNSQMRSGQKFDRSYVLINRKSGPHNAFQLIYFNEHRANIWWVWSVSHYVHEDCKHDIFWPIFYHIHSTKCCLLYKKPEFTKQTLVQQYFIFWQKQNCSWDSCRRKQWLWTELCT